MITQTYKFHCVYNNMCSSDNSRGGGVMDILTASNCNYTHEYDYSLHRWGCHVCGMCENTSALLLWPSRCTAAKPQAMSTGALSTASSTHWGVAGPAHIELGHLCLVGLVWLALNSSRQITVYIERGSKHHMYVCGDNSKKHAVANDNLPQQVHFT